MIAGSIVPKLQRGWRAIPIALRPVLLLAFLPIAVHAVLSGNGPKTSETHATSADDASLPDQESLARLITTSREFSSRKKMVRCPRFVDLSTAPVTDPQARVCRTLIELRFLDPATLAMTPRGTEALGDALSDDRTNIVIAAGSPRLRAILATTPPPQEAGVYRRSTRVDFAWSWDETNIVGRRLELSSHRRDMRGAAFLVHSSKGWTILGIRLDDASPDYVGTLR